MFTCIFESSRLPSLLTNPINSKTNDPLLPSPTWPRMKNLKILRAWKLFVLAPELSRYTEVVQQKGKQTFRKWVLPSRHPEGTKEYKNKALRTPFSKSGSNSVLKIEIDDPAIQAIEFIISDESRNRWFKNNGGHFHVKLPLKEKLISSVSVPEDLVQIQAYLRWERNVKQMYNPEQEKAC